MTAPLSEEKLVMAWGRVVFYPGGTEEQFEAVIGELGDAYRDALGRTYFAAGPSEGGWTMVMIWESQDHFQRWADEHLAGAHERAGARGWQSRPEAKDFTPTRVVT